jgi:hypothetical protein
MDRLPVELQEHVIDCCSSVVDLWKLRQVSRFFYHSAVLCKRIAHVRLLINQHVDKILGSFCYGMPRNIDASYLIYKQCDGFFYNRFMNIFLEFDNPGFMALRYSRTQRKFFQAASYFPQELYIFLEHCPNLATLVSVFQRHFEELRQKPIYGYLSKSYNLKKIEIDNWALDNPLSYVKNAIDHVISQNTFYVLNFPLETMRAFLFPLLRRNPAAQEMLLKIPMEPELLKKILQFY